MNSQVFFLGAFLLSAICGLSSSHLIEKRQAEGSISVVVVGDLINSLHSVSGTVYAYNTSTLIIDKFSFDGQGAGVYLIAATQGSNRNEYIRNAIDIPYPQGTTTSIDRAYNNERISITLPLEISAKDIKWLSVWCRAFAISFGDVTFPNLGLL